MNMRGWRIFDVTLPISHGMPVYEGDPEVTVEPWLSIAQGAPANVSRLAMGSHTGTHVDAPAHFRDGAIGVDRLPLDVLMGPALVVPLGAAGRVDAASLRGLDLTSHRRILLKTARSGHGRVGGIRGDVVGLTEDAAHLMVDSGVRLLGVEALSVESSESTAFPVHHTLLDAGVVILEGLDLSAVPPGEYELVCLPLKIQNGDGAPARVLLREVLPEPDRHVTGHGPPDG